jgi:hypothetical protein
LFVGFVSVLFGANVKTNKLGQLLTAAILHCSPHTTPPPQMRPTVPVALAMLALASTALAAVKLEEGFHHDIDETVVTVSAYHACALTPVAGVEFGGRPVCWGNKKFNRLNAVDVRRARWGLWLWPGAVARA